MPYIKPGDRAKYRPRSIDTPDSTGNLTFQLTCLVDAYLNSEGLSFSALSECVAALECAKLELYRRVISPYENDKLTMNGDVYQCHDHGRKKK